MPKRSWPVARAARRAALAPTRWCGAPRPRARAAGVRRRALVEAIAMSLPRFAWMRAASSGVKRDARCRRRRAERDAVVVDLRDRVAQREDLEAARVGEDRPVPGHEAVQPAEVARSARRRGGSAGGRCCRAGSARRGRAPRPGASALTVACVPTGMKTGVRQSPCAVRSTAGARGAVRLPSTSKGVDTLTGSASHRRRSRSGSAPRSRARRGGGSPPRPRTPSPARAASSAAGGSSSAGGRRGGTRSPA